MEEDSESICSLFAATYLQSIDCSGRSLMLSEACECLANLICDGTYVNSEFSVTVRHGK